MHLQRLGQRSATFNDLVFPLGYQSQYTPSTSKAKNPQHEAAVEDAARNGWVCIILTAYVTFVLEQCNLYLCSYVLQLDKMTVDVLKGYLTNQGIKGAVKLRKAECVQLIKSHLGVK